MQITTESISPEMAAEYLKKNTRNRPCLQGRIYDYANAMKRGEWVQNGDAIRFGSDGVLIDGQGRLKACIAADMSFTTLVVRGLDPETFKTIDLGKKRNVPDLLAIRGEKNTTKLTRALRFLLMYEAGTFANHTYTPIQLEECLSRHPSIRNWIVSSKKMYAITTHAAIVLTICYIASLTRTQTAEDFARLLMDGTGLEKGSAVLVLRERLMQDRAATSRIPASYAAQLVIYAYNAFAKGDSRFMLKGSRNSAELPRLMK